jgi:hypothetical protein
MRLVSALVALQLVSCARALHFYFESNEKRCFLEELPSDTIVEGEGVCHAFIYSGICAAC